VIPTSRDTRGHGTTGFAKFYKAQLLELLRDAPRRTA
jgi:homoserine O-acetyltransferase